ncbi:hypothetical protein CAPTEDRAFT_213361 [Capitella teleta]|uniref:Uncharacterized protein n=1 Tax=Capitella teleta TaxID=283909 RepID=R7U0W0_CAPTE|nr:hypothetical protein CAPTEDRAFT_213361 [Capitella teleta]|eukprot:ELT99649.1 hypothetical protein CAPTEDRAFT_213361 [Capitella teleta]
MKSDKHGRGSLLVDERDGRKACSSSGKWSRFGRGLLVTVLGLILLGFCSWTVILYSVKLLKLQERVEYLETRIKQQDDVIPQHIQKYLDTHLDALIQKKLKDEDESKQHRQRRDAEVDSPCICPAVAPMANHTQAAPDQNVWFRFKILEALVLKASTFEALWGLNLVASKRGFLIRLYTPG